MLLNRILFHGLGIWRLVGGFAGATMGWMLLFGGLQFWLLANRNLIQSGDILGPEYFLVHKPVPLLNLFGAAGAAFTEEEIAEVKKQPFVKAVAPMLVNRFQAHATIGASLSPLETDLFFEALPEEYLDLKTSDWTWRPETNQLPIIVPRDFLALYNFGFAQSRNLPQISETLIRQIKFNVQIIGQGKERELVGKITGFSQRINSILVPYEFLQWANAHYGEGPSLPSRLIVKAEAPAIQKLLQYFTARNYQYNSEQFKTARLKSTLQLVVGLVSAFGLVVLFLDFWILNLLQQLLISRNRERLQQLLWLGYAPGFMVRRYTALILAVLAPVNLASLLLLHWGTGWCADLFARYGYPVQFNSIWPVVAGMAGLSLLVLAGNILLLRQQINRLAA